MSRCRTALIAAGMTLAGALAAWPAAADGPVEVGPRPVLGCVTKDLLFQGEGLMDDRVALARFVADYGRIGLCAVIPAGAAITVDEDDDLTLSVRVRGDYRTLLVLTYRLPDYVERRKAERAEAWAKHEADRKAAELYEWERLHPDAPNGNETGDDDATRLARELANWQAKCGGVPNCH